MKNSIPGMITVGEISKRIGFIVTAKFLETMGFQPAAFKLTAKFYLESDYQGICDAICLHVQSSAAAAS